MSIQASRLRIIDYSAYEHGYAAGDLKAPFRISDDKKFAIYVEGSLEHLSPADICKLNSLCDRFEGSKNKDVKMIVAGALTRHFNKQGGNYQMIEFGAGRHPMSKEPKNYHAVEIDLNIITDLKIKGYSASTINTIKSGTLATDKPRAGVGIYTLHFWDPAKAAEDVKKVISQDGFFVANYMTAQPESTAQHREDLLASFKDAGLTVSIVRQGQLKTANDARGNKPKNIPANMGLGNEFWVVSFPPEANGRKAEATRFAETLNIQLAETRPNENWLKQRTYG